MTRRTKLAVGVVPRERFSVAAHALQRLLECTPEPFELIVVDAAVPPRWRSAIGGVLNDRPDAVRITTDEILLPNAARNEVIAHTDADWVCFLENDVLVEPGWLSFLLEACEKEQADVAVPLIIERFAGFDKVHFDDRLHATAEVITDAGPALRIDPRPDSKEQDRRAARRRVQFFETHCMLFTRQALEQTGLFDATITAQEEVDISLAVHAQGFAAVFEPRAVVTFIPPPPVHPDEREYYLRKWDPESYALDYQRVAERWRLVDPPSAMGVVKTRRAYADEPDPERQVAKQLTYRRLVADTAVDLHAVAPAEGALILVHDEELNLHDAAPGLRVLPFLERDGVAWGPPTDDDEAIAELERMRADGAGAIAFAWPSFWWLQHYRAFGEHLRANYPPKLENERIIAFDLAGGGDTR